MTRSACVLIVLFVACAHRHSEEVVPRADVASLEKQAKLAYDEKRFLDAGNGYLQAIRSGASDPTTAYNGACSFALAGDASAAFALLETALKNGFEDP